MKTYEQFRNELKPAYPISKGEIKLPIAISLENFAVNKEDIIKNLDEIMQSLFKKNNEARELADKGYEKGFCDLYEGNFTGIIRFDCMFNKNGELKLVEANTNWPDGLLMHDITYSALSDTKDTTHLDLFLKFFKKSDFIFILYEKGGFLDPHFLEEEKLKEHGYKVGIGTFEEIEFQNNGAYRKNQKINIIRLSMNSGRFSAEEYALLKEANIKFINTFDLAGLADKSLLRGIENPMIMKTFLLDETTKENVKKNKDKYVIKPRNLNEGIGVNIGCEQSQEQREQLIEKNHRNNYLAQEYIDISPKKSSLYLDGGIIEGDFYYDYCPHLFYQDGKMMGIGHILVRYSQNKIVNVLRGGGIGYVRF